MDRVQRQAQTECRGRHRQSVEAGTDRVQRQGKRMRGRHGQNAQAGTDRMHRQAQTKCRGWFKTKKHKTKKK
jgi:hypothetical protein